MASMNIPEILNMPPKLMPMVTEFNNYTYLYAEGGRGSAKTHSVARFFLYLASKYKLRIVCGREIQNSIEESVYTVLKDLIDEFNLPFEVQARKLTHKITGTTFTFKGFRDTKGEGSVSIKGMEGVDLLWIDEAQSVTKPTLDVLIPTIRKENSKVFLTMNRYMDDDAVHEYLDGRKDCLHIHIDFFENPFCPLRTKVEAEECRIKSEKEYDHIWLGKPQRTAGDMLFDQEKLGAAFHIEPFGVTSFKTRLIGFDFAAQGDDQCVAYVLDRVTNQHWKTVEVIPWDEPDAMVSVGKIIEIMGRFKPDAAVIDVGGTGSVVHNRLVEVGVAIDRFDGGSTEGVDIKVHANVRAQGYFGLQGWLDSGFLVLNEQDKLTVKELKKIKFKYRSSGARVIQAKADMKKDLKYSPDRADGLMMAVWAATHLLGNANTELGNSGQTVKRKTNHKRRR